jgi:hypothetical protein
MSGANFKPLTTQNLTISGTSAVTTNAVNAPFVRLASTTACYVQFGSSPTATTSDMLVNASIIGEVFKMEPGWKVAAIQVSAGGTLSVTGVSP